MGDWEKKIVLLVVKRHKLFYLNGYGLTASSGLWCGVVVDKEIIQSLRLNN